MQPEQMIIYAVSDATGDLAVNITVAAVRQFPDLNSNIERRAIVNTEEKVTEVVKAAKEAGAIIVYTLVSAELRQVLLDEAKAQGVRAVDVMGPVMDLIEHKAHLAPSDQPGMQYQMTGDYLKRTEMMTYTVKHDDGQGLDSLNEADIILLGISRTSKTPLSVYLAYRGYKVANVPLVMGVEPPAQLKNVDKQKMVGLVIDAEKMVNLRSSRLQKLGRPLNEDYADLDYIKEELAFQRRVFSQLGNIPVVSMTNKAIEEAATEILTILGR